jgi:hypothetical protein
MAIVTLLAIAVIILCLVPRLAAKRIVGGTRYSQLLRLTLGNRDTAEHLIAHEKKRYPTAAREALIQHAIARWEQHNR